jgi:hypothetical protein
LTGGKLRYVASSAACYQIHVAYVLLNVFLFYIPIFLLRPQATSVAASKLTLSDYKSEEIRWRLNPVKRS